MSTDIDRKLKDLMGRVAEMAPEAPSFPEETLTATPVPRRRSPRPVLVFAGAAMLVLAVALPLLLFRGGAGPDPAATTVPVPVPTTTVPEDPATTAPAEQAVPVTVYLIQAPENSLLGNPALVPVGGLGSAPEGEPDSLAALRTLVDPALSPPPGLESVIPDEVAVLGVVEEGDTITVDMNQAFLAGAGTGLLGDITVLNQIIYTVTQDNPEAGVVFTVEGQTPGPFGSEGLLLDTAFTREYYRDGNVNSVIVTTPVGPESTEISGVANVFEANVSLEIVAAGGEVVDSQFTTATCGSGCWGEFTFELDPALLEPGGQVRVFWNSPKDGEPSDVVVIPIPEDEEGLWNLTP